MTCASPEAEADCNIAWHCLTSHAMVRPLWATLVHTDHASPCWTFPSLGLLTEARVCVQVADPVAAYHRAGEGATGGKKTAPSAWSAMQTTAACAGV